MNYKARANAMREYFTEKELNIISYALELLAEHHEEKTNINNESGMNSNYIELHMRAAYDVRELKNNLDL